MNSRGMIEQIFRAGLDAVLPENLFRNLINIDKNSLIIQGKRYPFDPQKGIYVFGSGKSSVRTARVLEQILQDRITDGLVVSNYDDGSLSKIKVFVSSHPVPDQRSFEAADLLLEAISRLDESEFFIYVLSGGSSALMEKPIYPLGLEDLQSVSHLLLRQGMAIGEINIIRKHLSLIKGGGLGKVSRARGLVIVISDVLGDDLETIGSAPLYYDRSNYSDAEEVLIRYNLWNKLPPVVQDTIRKGLAGQLPETPKSVNPNLDHIIAGSNMVALARAKKEAESLGFASHIMTSRLRGEARDVARVIISLGEEILLSRNPFSPPVCLLFGGETTVTVTGTGRGGRNQEMCLAALKEIGNRDSLLFLSAGTDGIDGNSEAAGALVDRNTYEAIWNKGLLVDNYLSNNDSGSLFGETGSLIITGPTGTNVMDLTILLVGAQAA